ncbi:DUF2065 domain-containing protein [Desulfuromonas thiophila]|jgi:uncharacterized protein YjeT (DUF2065 family)|uniref:DUF2065 domain-containing protein n=1 Tax=Desulfuromonas thiophila TaxID=57664 RepID=A0A1G7CCC4_9BACT|nr:DUF2065 domain-containing protein [Desulfuromonas thiophila]MCK9172707.1 DUF2065 domain-containing protein [Desulfuromonas thiophila]MDD3801940.1 DUF2065 domain-containing protein [Desulfuromonas thiophila]MDY0398210.1 DUF2065 domain-containing protein [Desulfuromonas thiophila]SDE36988.1 hypothetical protein SAMN05661003_10936 [Desulfuromonas thiophila]
MEFFWSLIGVLLVVEGIPWFLSPLTMKRLLVQLLPVPVRHLRLLGLLLMLAGLLTLYCARHILGG